LYAAAVLGRAVHRARVAAPGDMVAVALLAVLTTVALVGRGPAVAVVLGVPWLAGAALLLTRWQATPAQRWTIGAGVVVSLAAAAASKADALALVALGAPFVVLVAWHIARHPVGWTIFALFLTGSQGTLPAYTNFPSGPVLDLVIVGLAAGAAASWLLGGRQRSAWLWPGIVLLLVYLAVTVFQVLGAEDPYKGLQSFRVSSWYLAAAVVVAYAPWRPGARLTVARGVVVVALLAGGYSALRWAIGPSSKELALALTNYNNLIDGEVRAIGSFPTGKLLATWMATAIPFCFAATLWMRGTWRLAAIAATGVCTVAMLAPDVRAGPAAVLPACLLVLAGFALTPAFGIRRLPLTMTAVVLVAVVGIGGFALTLGGKTNTAARYTALLEPERDPAVQGRLFKWSTALDSIDEHPLGTGVGTSGVIQTRFGRFSNISSIEVDNSYLKVGLEQGFAVMVLFVLAVLAVVGGLWQRAVTAGDPQRAGLLLGCAGAVAGMAIIWMSGTFSEGPTALFGWLLAGLGMSATVWRGEQDEPL
jgi:O-antigen ligase